MSRYIDGEPLEKYYTDLATEHDIGFGDVGRMVTINITHVIETIKNAPTIDIVRCKECRHRRTDDCPMCNECGRNVCPTADDNFCSYGERLE